MIKSEYRKWALATRKSWSETSWIQLNVDLQKQAALFFEKLPANAHILSFQSIEKQRELAMEPIHQLLAHSHLAFPRVNQDELIAYAKGPHTRFEVSNWGILEPTPDSSVMLPPETFDAILIPLLVADQQGNRVGYGKGFYDRYLPSCSPACLKIGLSLLELVDPIEDVEAHDIPLDLVITPMGIQYFNGFYRKKPFDSTI
jgi:5-formyltetrahydrofolate cyclo-ligase